MNMGWHDICIACKDLPASKSFYTALGMEVTHDADDWVHLTNGNVHISLMSFLGGNWLTFRGADVYAVHSRMQTAGGVSAPGVPEKYDTEDMGSDGVHWKTRDPDGNVVYFDTTTDEQLKSKQIEQLLVDLERYLSVADIESTSFQTFKSELMDRYLQQVSQRDAQQGDEAHT